MDAIVVPDEHLIYVLIVGRDFLEQKHVMLVKRGKEIILRQLPSAERQFEHMSDVNLLDASTERPIRISTINEEAQRKCTDYNIY